MKSFIRLFLVVCFVFGIFGNVYSQQKKDKGEFIDYKNEFMDRINRELGNYYSAVKDTKKKNRKTFKLDFKDLNIPKSTEEFKKVWFNFQRIKKL